MRIVFHAGFHKTGTTSVQSALMAHAPALAGRFHVVTREMSADFVAAAEAARKLSARRVGAPEAALVQALNQWVAGLPEGVGLIASCEDFAGHMPSRFGVRDYRAVQRVMPLVAAALRQRWPGAQIEVIFTTRRREAWLKSIHWQLAKHPQLLLTRAAFVAQFGAAADFGAVLAPLAGLMAGVGLHVLPLEDIARRRLGPVEALYDLAGLPEDLRAGLAPLPPANQSPDIDLADEFVAMNLSGLPADELRALKRGMLSYLEQLGREG